MIGLHLYISRYFDITAAPRESNQSVMTSSQVYGEVTRSAVDLDNTAGADFELELLPGRVFGKVVTPDEGAFSYPFGEMQGFPVAGLFLPVGQLADEFGAAIVENVVIRQDAVVFAVVVDSGRLLDDAEFDRIDDGIGRCRVPELAAALLADPTYFHFVVV